MAGPRFPHILRAIYERPWAIRPDYLGLIVDLIQFRAAGGVLSDDEIRGRINAAQNGPRQGGRQSGAVAVIPVYGPISARQNMMTETSGGTSVEQLTSTFRGAVGDPAIDAIVLEFDSPGGTVDGIPELAAEIRAARGAKPLYAVANTMAASAAYWLACQCDCLFVTPSGTVGSIGVFAAHHDMSAAYEMDGDSVTLITASVSPFKAEGNEYQPLSEEAAAAIQKDVDAFGQMFVADVAKGRSQPIDDVRRSYGQGRTMLAGDALAAGMVDGIATLDEVVRQAGRAAIQRQRDAAAAAAFTPDIHAGLGSGLPFSDRLSLVTAGVSGLVEHARERADMRAKQGRFLSEADRAGLIALAGSLAAIASDPAPETETEPPTPEPEPRPPAGAAHRRAQLALALAELGA